MTLAEPEASAAAGRVAAVVAAAAVARRVAAQGVAPPSPSRQADNPHVELVLIHAVHEGPKAPKLRDVAYR